MSAGTGKWSAATFGLAALVLSVAVGAGQSKSAVADAAMNGDRAAVRGAARERRRRQRGARRRHDRAALGRDEG